MFGYFMPTEVLCGRGCVSAEGGRLKELGRRALVVAGNSARKNGALADLTAALERNGQTYAVYDRVTPNPGIGCIRGGVELAKECGADFVVGIGGGSQMDAAKAIALFAVEDRADDRIFAGGYGSRALPIAQIPTTAGTGSEVTQYSILTDDAGQTKRNVSSPAMFAKLAFLDGKYTETLPRALTIATALDAFSHAAESLLSKRATPLSVMLSEECLRGLYPLLSRADGDLSPADRDALLYASMLAGMAIAQSGTTAVHGMGYQLTYFYGVEHGRANGLLLGETLRLCREKGVGALKRIEDICGGTEEICAVLDRLLGAREEIPRERLLGFAARTAAGKNILKSAYEPTEAEIARIFLRSFGSPD